MQGDAEGQTSHASDVNTTEMYIDKSTNASDAIEVVKSNNNNNKHENDQMHFKEEIKLTSKSVMGTHIKVEQTLEKMSQQMSYVLEPKITYASKAQNRFELLAHSESLELTS